MTTIDERDLRKVDLDLPVTFEGLMRERHVTRTAHVRGISRAAAGAATTPPSSGCATSSATASPDR